MVGGNGTEGKAKVRERGLEQSTAARRSSNIDRSGVEFEARQVSVFQCGGENERKRERENRRTGREHQAESRALRRGEEGRM